VSAYTSANIDKILALQPDLVLTFSDLQADIADSYSPSDPAFTPRLQFLTRIVTF
jgi:iron complex transport system substrate-binding protein